MSEEMIYMPQIRPITDLRNTSEISDLCNTLGEPVFITRNGYGDMVIMSNATYEKEVAMSDIYKKLLLGQRQIDAGETIDGDKVFGALRSKHDYEV